MGVLAAHEGFRDRLASGAHLTGAFVKTPGVQPVEILAAAGLDFVVIDQEHAPFDRGALDTALFAARVSGLASLVRVSSPTPDAILSVLDCGATGVLVPHVATARKAREVAAASRYLTGSRGYSGSVRAAGYGGGKMADYLASADALVTVIAQIEDKEALDEIDEIATTPGVDALFIGRGDLTVSFGQTSSDTPPVRAAVERIAQAAKKANKPICVFVSGLEEARWLHGLGATAFVVSSDQGFMRKAASQAVQEFRTLAADKVREQS